MMCCWRPREKTKSPVSVCWMCLNADGTNCTVLEQACLHQKGLTHISSFLTSITLLLYQSHSCRVIPPSRNHCTCHLRTLFRSMGPLPKVLRRCQRPMHPMIGSGRHVLPMLLMFLLRSGSDETRPVFIVPSHI